MASRNIDGRLVSDVDSIDIKALFNDYQTTKKAMLDRVKRYAADGVKIIFYGVSFYFQLLFRQMTNFLEPARCYYYDDNFKESFEPAFNLPRAETFEADSLVIICSTNAAVQQKIAEKISRVSQSAVLLPWNTCLDRKRRNSRETGSELGFKE